MLLSSLTENGLIYDKGHKVCHFLVHKDIEGKICKVRPKKRSWDAVRLRLAGGQNKRDVSLNCELEGAKKAGSSVLIESFRFLLGVTVLECNIILKKCHMFTHFVQTCSSGWKDTFVVEPNAQTVVITITGNDVNANAAVAMKDGAGREHKQNFNSLAK